MNIIIDTSVLNSLALRRQRSKRKATGGDYYWSGNLPSWSARDGQPCWDRSGRNCSRVSARISKFESLRDHLRAFPDIPLEAEEYEEAASFFNKCRAKGIQGSNTDYLICAAGARRRFGILTTDADFAHFARRAPDRTACPSRVAEWLTSEYSGDPLGPRYAQPTTSSRGATGRHRHGEGKTPSGVSSLSSSGGEATVMGADGGGGGGGGGGLPSPCLSGAPSPIYIYMSTLRLELRNCVLRCGPTSSGRHSPSPKSSARTV